MVWKYAWREFRREWRIDLIIIIQTAIMMLASAAGVTTAVTRWQYYAPVRELLEQPGAVMYVSYSGNRTGEFPDLDGLRQKLTDCTGAVGLYGMPSVVSTAFTDFMVFTPEMWRIRPLHMKEGSFAETSDSEYPQIAAAASTGLHPGDLVKCRVYSGEQPTDLQMQVSGIFDDGEQILMSDTAPGKQQDFRMLYRRYGDWKEQSKWRSETGKPSDFCVISMHEAQKICPDEIVPHGPVFFTYNESITSDQKEKNAVTVSQYGVYWSFDNRLLRENSLSYIYEQLAMLTPVLIGTAILLFISILCVCAVSVTKHLRQYAVYRACGLTVLSCGGIAVCKALLVSGAALLLSVLLIAVKGFVPALNGLLLSFGIPQLLPAAAVIAVNVLLSLTVSVSILRKSAPNQLLRSN